MLREICISVGDLIFRIEDFIFVIENYTAHCNVKNFILKFKCNVTYSPFKLNLM